MINSNESFLTEFIKPLSSHANCLADGVIQSILLVILSRDSKKKKKTNRPQNTLVYTHNFPSLV